MTAAPTSLPLTSPGAAGADGPGAGTAWRSWHLHLASDARPLADRVVVDVVAPVVRAAGRPWFFVRYWQGGPHVRVRVRDLDDEQARQVEQELERRLAVTGRLLTGEAPITAAEHADAAARLVRAGEVPAQGAELLLPPGVHSSDYEPEVDRYGGPQLLPAAEALFHLSSELTVGVLAGSPSTGARAGCALRAAAAAAAALTGPERAAFASLGLRAWCDWVAASGVPAAALDQLRRPQSGPGGLTSPTSPTLDFLLPPALQPWTDALRRHVEQARAHTTVPGRLLFSHVHMLHNRLGLRPVEEVQTYARLVRLVGAAPQQPVA